MIRSHADLSPVTAPRRGGPAQCPRPCTECAEGEHHFSDVMLDFAELHGEYDAGEHGPVRAQATAAGCEAWYVCKHCEAWEEYLDDEDDGGEELDEEGLLVGATWERVP